MGIHSSSIMNLIFGVKIIVQFLWISGIAPS